MNVDTLNRQQLTRVRRDVQQGKALPRDAFYYAESMLTQLYNQAISGKENTESVRHTLLLVPAGGKRLDGSTELTSAVLSSILTYLSSNKKTREYASYLAASIAKTLGSTFLAGGGVAEVMTLLVLLSNTYLGADALKIKIDPEQIPFVKQSTDLYFHTDADGITVTLGV